MLNNKSREDGCRCLLILKEQVRLLCGVSWVLIFFYLIGDQDLTTSKEVDCGVLLLLMRSFEGYSSSWDFLSRIKKSLRLDSAIQGKRPMRCHRTLEDWIFKHWIAETKGFIYKKLWQKKPIYRLCAQRSKTL
jgi:hypothetical protein